MLIGFFNNKKGPEGPFTFKLNYSNDFVTEKTAAFLYNF
jgi:hypothetical protein